MTPRPQGRPWLSWFALAILPLIIFGVLYVLPVYELVRGSFDNFDPIKGSSTSFQVGFDPATF